MIELTSTYETMVVNSFPRLNKYIPKFPHPKQAVFLALPHKEALFGGAAGGGKSEALLMAALQYVDVPNYSALILRKTFKELNKSDAIMSRAKQWLKPFIESGEVKWSEADHVARFPNNAKLEFGYIQTDADLEQYQSAAYQFIGWDELTHHPRNRYIYMLSRCRGPACELHQYGMSHKACDKLGHVPLRVRGATNPGSEGHAWVKERFISPGRDDRPFVPSKLSDNPSLNAEAYNEMFAEMDEVERQQLQEGNWDILAGNGLFPTSLLKECLIDAVPMHLPRIRRWDLAATEPLPGERQPDYAAAPRCAWDARTKLFYIEHCYRLQGSVGKITNAIAQVASFDGRDVPIVIEQEPGASGIITVKSISDNVVPTYIVHPQPVSGKKITRIKVLAARAQLGMLRIVRGPWNKALFDEGALISENTSYKYDDQWDSCAGAYMYFNKKKVAGSWGRRHGSR